MIFLQLFWTFFQIGLFTIGGGHAMIPLIMREVVAKGWLSEEVLIDFIAISESTPGPFAVNIATYTGVEVAGELGVGAGIFGAICATLGVVLPSVIIIILIVKLFSEFMKRRVVQEVFIGVRASVTGLLASVFISLCLTVLFAVNSVWNVQSAKPDYIGIVLFAALFGISFIKIKGRKVPPVALILLSAVIGVLTYGFIPI